MEGSIVKMDQCQFNSSQDNATLLQPIGAQLVLTGKIEFASSIDPVDPCICVLAMHTRYGQRECTYLNDGVCDVPSHCSRGDYRDCNTSWWAPPPPPAVFIKTESALAAVELEAATVSLGNNMASLLIGGAFQVQNSSILFESDPVSTVRIEPGAVATWHNSRFEGVGNITVAAGVKLSSIALCSFSEDVALSFDQIRHTDVNIWCAHHAGMRASRHACAHTFLAAFSKPHRL